MEVVYSLTRAKVAAEMNATFAYFTTQQKNAHARHMIGCIDEIRYDKGGLVIVWLGKRGCPMVINRDTLKLTYYQTYQEALEVCEGKEGVGVQGSLF